MLKFGIRSRLVISFLTIVLFAVLAISSYVLWYFYHHNLEMLKSNMQNQAKVVEVLLHDDLTDETLKSHLDEKVKLIGSSIVTRITMIDRQGNVLADSVEWPANMENHSERPEMMQALTGQIGYSVRYSHTTHENLLYTALPIWEDNEIIGVIRLDTPLTQVEAIYEKVRNTMIIVFLITLLLASALSVRLAKNFVAPLEEIIGVAKEIADGNLDKRLYLRTGDEVELLAHTLNHLASNLDDKVNEIMAEKHKLELILEHMDNAVIVLDQYGRVTTVNKTAALLFNIKPSMLGQHNMNVIGKSLLDRSAHEAIETGHSNMIDLKIQTYTQRRAFQVFLAPILNTGKGSGATLAVFHDITTIQEIHQRQSDFIANASHELSTPLTAIKGFAETLLAGAMDDESLRKKFINIIYTEAERMHRLVRDLLQLAKLDSEEYCHSIILEATSLAPIFSSIIDELSPHWQKKQQQIELLHAETPVFVKAHPDWLKQILINLLENAIKYTPEAGKIELSYTHDQEYAYLKIKDTGIGIPAKDLPFIFERFYRVDKARSRNGGGTGLGLSIVKFICDMIGGKIQVESESGSGTTFTIKMPLSI